MMSVQICIYYQKQSGTHHIDMRKTFDTVDHNILISKLKANGVNDTSLKLFKSYLTIIGRKSVK